MSFRYRRITEFNSEALPTLPFVTIMLGLMSVMTLATLSLSLEKRQKNREQTVVNLQGIPSRFLPFQMRATEDGISWLDNHAVWRTTSLSVFVLQMAESNDKLPPRDDANLYQFLWAKIEENKKLSFSHQQNSLILWVEPEGINTATLFEYLISYHQLPLRIGLLPILKKETIYSHDGDGPTTY